MDLQRAIQLRKLLDQLQRINYMATSEMYGDKMECLVRRMNEIVENHSTNMAIWNDVADIKDRHFAQMRRELGQLYDKLKERIETEY